MKEYNSRSSNSFSKDVDYLNVFFEPTKNKVTQENYYDIWTRPGLINLGTGVLQSTNVRFVYFWEATQTYYVWIDDDLQLVDTSGNIYLTLSAVLGTSSGPVTATEFLYDTGAVKLVFTDGQSIKTIDNTNTVVASTDPDIPTPIQVSLVFLDGYLFVVKAGTFDIYNSDLNDPLAWTAGNYISSEMLPDGLSAIAKLNNYLVALGTSSVEYFWDAANVSGSPLQRNDTPVKYNGYLGGLASFGNKLYYIGNTTESRPGVFVLEDFKIKELGDESLWRQLESTQQTFSEVYASIVSIQGHSFYVFTFGSGTSYAIDLETNLWSRWAVAGGTTFSAKFSTNSKTAATYLPVLYINGRDRLSHFDKAVTTDFGTSYSMIITTERESFDSFNLKTINRLTIVGDRPTANTNISISWSDDDYQTFSSAQTLNINQELPCIYQCGSFRRRAHRLSCSPTVPFRLQYLEADINIGNS